MRNIKIIALILIVFGICSCFNIQNINGYFLDKETLSDDIVFGNVETEIIEEYDTKTIVPGEEFKKIVKGAICLKNIWIKNAM